MVTLRMTTGVTILGVLLWIATYAGDDLQFLNPEACMSRMKEVIRRAAQKAGQPVRLPQKDGGYQPNTAVMVEAYALLQEEMAQQKWHPCTSLKQ